MDWSGSQAGRCAPFGRRADPVLDRRCFGPRGHATRGNRLRSFFCVVHFPLDSFRRPVRPMRPGASRNGRVGPSVGPRAAQSARRPRKASAAVASSTGDRSEAGKSLPILSAWKPRTLWASSRTTSCSVDWPSCCASRGASKLISLATSGKWTRAGSLPARPPPRCSLTAQSVLHLSEAEAYLRIAAARASREHPMLLTMLADGRIHLTAMAKLAPHLTRENRDVLLKRAAHKTRRQIEELIAELTPRPDAPAVMRKLPERQTVTRAGPGSPTRFGAGPPRPPSNVPGGADLAPRANSVWTESRPRRPACRSPRPVIQPLALGRYRIQFTAGAELRDKLERLKALMRSSVPDGDLAAIIEQAVTEKLERLETRRFAKTNVPRKGSADTDTLPSSRHIPAAVRRAVHERDEGRCRFVDEQGRRYRRARQARVPPPEVRPRRRPFSGRPSPCCVGPTTTTWPKSTMAVRPWPGIGA